MGIRSVRSPRNDLLLPLPIATARPALIGCPKMLLRRQVCGLTCARKDIITVPGTRPGLVYSSSPPLRRILPAAANSGIASTHQSYCTHFSDRCPSHCCYSNFAAYHLQFSRDLATPVAGLASSTFSPSAAYRPARRHHSPTLYSNPSTLDHEVASPLSPEPSSGDIRL